MRCFFLLILLCASAFALRAQETPQPLAFSGVTVVDVRTGELRPKSTVVVEGKRIRAVGRTGKLRLPEGTRVIDATGKYVIPGLIDTHAHLFMPWRHNWPDTIAQFGWVLANGVTTVRDVMAGGLEPNYVALRTAADSGRILAPRMHISAFMPNVKAETGASSLEEAVARVPQLGLDGIKLRGTPREEALEIIRAARVVGLPVYGHTDGIPTDSTRESYTLAAVQTGISGLMHVYSAFEPDGIHPTNTGPRATYRSSHAERVRADLHDLSVALADHEAWQRMLIDTMVARGAWLEPTLTSLYHGHPALIGQCTKQYDLAAVQRYYPWRTSAGKAEFTPAQADSVQGICRAIKSFVRRFYEAGGTIVAGASYILSPPLGVVEEVRLLADAGLPPLAALQAATINAARALQMEEEIGTVEPGKFADLVLLDANPLDEITNVQRISAVIADGRLLDREELLARTGTTPHMVAVDDLLEKMHHGVRKIAFEHPDSTVDVVIHTDGTFSANDVRQIEKLMRSTAASADGSSIRVRGRALGTRFVSRIRFVTRIELTDARSTVE